MDLTTILHRLKARLLRRRLDIDEVEDIVQSAWLRMHQYQLGGQKVHSPEAFLHVTSVNLANDHFRRAQRVREVELETEGQLSQVINLHPDPADVVELQARLAHLARGLDQLSEKTRSIILARRLEGLSVAEIAHRKQMTVAAVEKQLSRGTYRLLKWMDHQ